jgi:uncharacterized protein YndB with AHSA1/START domain
MARVEASVDIPAPLADVWDLYFDPQRWASWVDGFAALVSEHGYPEAGGELVWRSSAAGRGQVRETVLAHEPRSLHRIKYEDPESAGELETTFEMLPGADPRMTRVSQRLTYGLLGGGPLGAVTDFLFIRSQMRRSLERSLSDLRLETGDGG